MKTAYERSYKKTVTQFFDGRTSYDNGSTIERALPLLDMVELKPGQQILDVATGTGIVAIAAAEKVGPTGQVTGVDFSAGMLQQAQHKSDQLGLSNIDWMKADADYAAFKTDIFDAIFCSSAIVYLKNIERTLKLWHRWLKPNGAAIFSGWSDQSYPAPWIIESCAHYGVTLENINAPTGTPERCIALMESAGFESVCVNQRQLGKYRTIEELSAWNGSWFHPKSNPLDDIPDRQRQQIVDDYHRRLIDRKTKDGIWCESLAYYVAGRKPCQE